MGLTLCRRWDDCTNLLFVTIVPCICYNTCSTMHDQKPVPSRGEGRGGNLPQPPGPHTLWGALQKFCWKIKHIICHCGGAPFEYFPRGTKGAVAPGGTFFEGAELWVSNTSQGSKVLSECRKCHFRNPNFKTFQRQLALGPPRLTRLTAGTYTPWGGRHFKNSPLVHYATASTQEPLLMNRQLRLVYFILQPP